MDHEHRIRFGHVPTKIVGVLCVFEEDREFGADLVYMIY